jgi:hypothetical protein
MRYGANRLDFVFTGAGLGETVQQRDAIVQLCRTARAQAGSGQWTMAQQTYQHARGLWTAAGSPSSIADDIETTRVVVFGELPALEVAQRDELYKAGLNNATPEGQTWIGSVLSSQVVNNAISSTGGFLAKNKIIGDDALMSGRDVKAKKDASRIGADLPWDKIVFGALGIVLLNNLLRRV